MHICRCTCIMNLKFKVQKCLKNFEFKWVQVRFLIGQVLGSQEMYRKFCPKMYQEMFLKPWHFLLPKTFRKFHILGIFPGLGNFIFLPVHGTNACMISETSTYLPRAWMRRGLSNCFPLSVCLSICQDFLPFDDHTYVRTYNGCQQCRASYPFTK